jgi:hypothetical protein
VNLLQIPLFDVAFKDGSYATLNALETLAKSSEIHDFTDHEHQNIVSVRFLSCIKGIDNIPLNWDLSKLWGKGIWNPKTGKTAYPIGHIVEDISTGTYPNFLRGVTKPLDEFPVKVCDICLGKTILRKTLFSLGCGAGNAGWVHNDATYAHPLGNNLKETLELCELTQSSTWWEGEKGNKETFWCSFAPNRFSFLGWQTGTCYLCGKERQVAQTLEKAVVASKLVMEWLKGHQEPMLLKTPRTKVKGEYFKNFGPDNFPGVEGGRLIKEALANGVSRFRYARLNGKQGKFIKWEAGIVDLNKKNLVPPEQIVEKETKMPLIGGFLRDLYKISKSRLLSVKEGNFTSAEAMKVVADTVWNNPPRTDLKLLLLRLYANYPECGNHVPIIHGNLLKTVLQCRKQRTPIDWYQFALTLTKGNHA